MRVHVFTNPIVFFLNFPHLWLLLTHFIRVCICLVCKLHSALYCMCIIIDVHIHSKVSTFGSHLVLAMCMVHAIYVGLFVCV